MPKPAPKQAPVEGKGLSRYKRNKLYGRGIDPTIDKLNINSKLNKVKHLTKRIIGFGEKGIEISSSIEYAPFGKFIINMSKLDENILRVLYSNSYINVKELKSMRISDDFKTLLLYMIDNKQYNESFYNLLSDKEKAIFRILTEKSAVKKVLKINFTSEKDEYKIKKQRWEIISGEININNNSDVLANEARDLLKWFFDNKYINKNEYNDNLEIVNENDNN
jgi:hypothetical protein